MLKHKEPTIHHMTFYSHMSWNTCS